MEDAGGQSCEATVRSTLTLLGTKWSIPILWELLHDERGFAELRRRVDGVSQKVLSAELKTLVGAGLVEREVAPSVPPRVTYRITPHGVSLEPVFDALHRWAQTHEARESGVVEPSP